MKAQFFIIALLLMPVGANAQSMGDIVSKQLTEPSRSHLYTRRIPDEPRETSGSYYGRLDDGYEDPLDRAQRYNANPYQRDDDDSLGAIQRRQLQERDDYSARRPSFYGDDNSDNLFKSADRPRRDDPYRVNPYEDDPYSAAKKRRSRFDDDSSDDAPPAKSIWGDDLEE